MSEWPLVEVAVIGAATAAIWVGSDWLEGASSKLATHYNLPPVVQGGIIAAVGSSFPELASVVFAALAGSFGLGAGGIVGSAIFNILVIPALAVVFSGSSINASRTLVHKETLFYMVSIFVLFLTFAMSLIYNPTNGSLNGSLSGTLTRPMVLFPLGVYGLYLFMQWQDTAEYTGNIESSSISPLKQWGLLAAGLLIILVAVERLVHSVIVIGDLVGTPDFLWGAVVVAAATSLPDALVSIQAAGREHDVASIANVLGSNTFDLLVVIPIGVLLTGSAVIQFSVTAPMMGCLIAATGLLFVTLRTHLALTLYEAYLLLVAYAAFVLWVMAEALSVTNVIPS
ncbi:cation:H+ antiporter [Halovenus aranensis]|jgi:cation:H+ antiporter|uniref:Cation:H+ antiporter n=1 Tax=Halovenus aranensis TaxID=890420 RepID=A0A1G8W541_9EURY|nr:sodium:calcium antiporter [Halovenus aranensis]SDJ72845.1 cation:H+ antiporter [Halovenus aranensis]